MAFLNSCCGDSVPTPFGDLEGEELEKARDLQIIFSELISDGSTTCKRGEPCAVAGDYAQPDMTKNLDKARAMWANPVQYLELSMRAYNPWKDLVHKIASERLGKPSNIRDISAYGNVSVTARVGFQMAHKRTDRDDQTAAKPEAEEANDSDFSASFYGPMYASDSGRTEAQTYPEHRYYLVRETHAQLNDNDLENIHKQKYPFYIDEDAAMRIRYFLLTATNKRGQQALHLATRIGDRHFVTMLVNEAKELIEASRESSNGIKHIVNAPDRDGMTPLYLLCEGEAEKEEEKVEKDDEEDQAGQEMPDYIEGEDEQMQPDEMQHEGGKLDQMDSDIDNIDAVKVEAIQRAEVDKGLRYSPWMPMKELIDGPSKNFECTRPSRCLLVKLLLEHGADPNYVSPNVNHTPLHWLAYYGDHRAIEVYLQWNDSSKLQAKYKYGGCVTVKPDQWVAEYGALNLFIAENGLTPVDIAGDNDKLYSLRNMVKYLLDEENRLKVEREFYTDEVRSKYPGDRFIKKQSVIFLKKNKSLSEQGRVPCRPIGVMHVDDGKLTKPMKAYLRLAYWAIRLTNIDIHSEVERADREKLRNQLKEEARRVMYFFLMDLGVSPFLRSYEDRSIVHACVKAAQFDLLRELLTHEYQLYDEWEYTQFEKSVEVCEDARGDNVFHETFKLSRRERNEFLKIIYKPEYTVKMKQLNAGGGCCGSRQFREVQPDGSSGVVETHIGGFTARNKLSFLPTDYENTDEIAFPDDVIQNNQEVFQSYLLGLEADYVIKMSGSRQGLNYDIVTKQLKDLQMEKNEEYFPIFVKKERSVIDQAANLFKQQESEAASAQNEEMDIYIAIKMTAQRMDRLAEKHNVYGDLDVSNIRLPYDRIMGTEYTKFDSRQRYIIIMKELKMEIDFDRYVDLGIIDDHYPLHRTKMTKKIQASITDHFWTLVRTIAFWEWLGYDWFEHAQPLHMIKKYFGEKYAFFYGFFLTYTAYLLLPAMLGLALFVYEIVMGALHGYNERTLDSPWNTLMGVFIACWSTAFVENWRHKQDKLIFQWDMDTPQDVLMNDYRTEFKYMKYYNRRVDVPLKQRVRQGYKVDFLGVGCCRIPIWVLDFLLFFGMLTIIGVVMWGFEVLTADDLETVDADAIAEVAMEDWMDPTTLVYAYTLKLLEWITEYCTTQIVALHNYQWIKDHESQIAYRLFFSKCLTNFLPLLFVAFVKQNYYTLFAMLLVILVLDMAREAFQRLFFLSTLVRYPRSMVKRQVDHIIDQDKENYSKRSRKVTDADGRQVEVVETDGERKTRLQSAVLRRQVVLNAATDVEVSFPPCCIGPFQLWSYEKEADINGQLMDVVMQFGYVTFFSTVFPLAAFVMLMLNLMTLNTISMEIDLKRRSLPSVSVGIGVFITMLEFISQAAVAINVALAYFTSHDTRDFLNEATGLGDLNFFILLVGVEHGLYFLKLVLRQCLSDGAERYEDEQRINNLLEEQFCAKQEQAHKNDFEQHHTYAARAFLTWMRKAAQRVDAGNAEMQRRKEQEAMWSKALAKKEMLAKKHTKLPPLQGKRKLIQDDVEVRMWVYPDDKKEVGHDKDPVVVRKFEENFEYLGED